MKFLIDLNLVNEVSLYLIMQEYMTSSRSWMNRMNGLKILATCFLSLNLKIMVIKLLYNNHIRWFLWITSYYKRCILKQTFTCNGQNITKYPFAPTLTLTIQIGNSILKKICLFIIKYSWLIVYLIFHIIKWLVFILNIVWKKIINRITTKYMAWKE